MSIGKRLYTAAAVICAFALGVIITLYVRHNQAAQPIAQNYPSVTPAANSENLHKKIAADGKQATVGLSYVLRDSTNPYDLVHLRAVAAPGNAGAPVSENVNDLLQDNSHVQMRCWVDGASPVHGASPRWFWVVVTDPPHPGETGYIWSDLVWGQIQVPHCDDALTTPADPLRNAHVMLAQGKAADQGGYFYAVTLNGFPAGWVANVACFDSTGPNDVFKSFPMTASGSGQAFKDDGCRSGEGAQHWVFVDGVESNRVTWTTPKQPKPVPTTTISRPDPQPSPTRQPPPPTATLIVYNKVTNGAYDMREDSTPTYLSSSTQPYCKSRGCALGGTDMWSGASITAECWLDGDRMTNGQDNSSVDDNNPGLFTSSLWYRIRWPDGRRGYIAEIWVQDRGQHGLLHC